MNIPLLRRIQRQIDKTPERFRMGMYAQKVDCGTAFCIGGLACALNKKRINSNKASILLGLGEYDYTSGSLAFKLFHQSHWPNKFRGPDDGSKKAASRAIARIDHFIATEGRE